MKHEFKEIEPKWQKKWEEARVFHAVHPPGIIVIPRSGVVFQHTPEPIRKPALHFLGNTDGERFETGLVREAA